MNDILPVTRLVTNEYWQRSLNCERVKIYANNFISLILRAPLIPERRSMWETINKPFRDHLGLEATPCRTQMILQPCFEETFETRLVIKALFICRHRHQHSTCKRQTIFSQLHSWILWKFLLLDSESFALIFHGWGLTERKICKSNLIVLITSCW